MTNYIISKRFTIILLASPVIAGMLFGGCMRAPEWVSNPSPEDSADAVPASDHAKIAAGFLDEQAFDDIESISIDDDWRVLRVGGNLEARISGKNGDWRYELSRVDTELPEGYPPPTPPGAIELKKYPEVRRAEVSGRLNPNLGMNLGFWPLFQHIQRNDIAMTAPVEMDYHGWDGSVGGPKGWTMSFLYRTTELGPVGQDGRVRIVDSEPVTMLSLGMNGSYRLATIVRGIETLNAWLEQQDEWQVVGEPRAFYYNDPGVPDQRKWLEVQLPVKANESGGPQ